MAEQSMRERATDGARKYLTRCTDLGTPIDYAALADAVLAEIETPTEGMCRAMAHAWSPELDHEKPLGQDKVFDSYLEDMADGYKAGIRAAREGS
jgi:hypothetical protein